MRNLLPQFISEKFEKEKFNGSFDATIMFVDISGFTAMTQSLMQNGKEGAEILTEIINRIFTPSIEIIYKLNGFISTFAGDAFTAIFPMERAEKDAGIISAIEIQRIFSNLKIQKTKFGEFELKIKIGLSLGLVEWRILRAEDVFSYYFRGKAIKNAAESEHHCLHGEIVIDRKMNEKTNFSTTEITKGFFQVSVTQDSFEIQNRHNIFQKYIDYKIQQKFIPDSILQLKSKGEFRNVISCFISFQETENFYSNLEKVQRLAIEYGGYFNKIDFGDKGGVVLVLFGAPVSWEKLEYRACDFALSVKNIKNFECRIGISSGIAFTGFVGSELRAEYTALGMAVNLAARYMMKANWGEIFVDKFIFSRVKDNFEILFLQSLALKGFKEKIPTYKLVRKKEFSTTFISTGKFINRKKELEKLFEYLQPLRKKRGKRFGGIVYVEGAAGTGKSRLIKEFKKRLSRDEFAWIYLPCDAILKKSFNPIHYFMHRFFEQSNDENELFNKKKFEEKIDLLSRKIKNRELKSEFLRTIPFLGALLGLHWKNSLYEQLDAKGRYENILFALKTLFSVISLQKPLIIELEDINWIDDDTRAFLQVLVRNEENFPILIIASSRFNDDGSVFRLNLQQVREYFLTLGNLDSKNAKILITYLLNENRKPETKLPSETFKLIWEKSQGNPFYIEQLIYFLREQNIFDEKLRLKKINFSIPENISSVIISRIDKLNPDLKEVTKAASVLGQRFLEKILKNMISQKKVENYIHDAEKENIWYSISDSDRVFQSSFVRDAIYDLILKKDVRNLHLQAAQTYEKLFRKNLREYFADIAYNYEKAEKDEKAIHYMGKAAEYEKELYHIKSAIKFYDKIIRQISFKKKQYTELLQKAILDKIELLLIAGDTKEADELFNQIQNSDFVSAEFRDRFYYLFARYLSLISAFDRLKEFISRNLKFTETENYRNHLQVYFLETLRYLNEDEEFEKTAEALLTQFKKQKQNIFEARVTNIQGVYFLQKSRYQEALAAFERNYQIVKKENNKMLMRAVLHNIGVVHSRMGKREKAMEYYRKSLKIALEIGDKNACSKLYSDMATIYAIQGNVDKAISFYEKGLSMARTIGNRMQEELILYNLADGYYRLEKYRKAIKYLENSKRICREISDIVGITFANDLFGDILFTLGKISKAKEIYLENLELQKKLKDEEGIAHTYGNLGNVCKAEKDFKSAEKYYRMQQESLAKVGDKEGEGKAFFNWGVMELDRKNLPEAKKKLENALKLFEMCSFQIGIDLTKEQLAKIKI